LITQTSDCGNKINQILGDKNTKDRINSTNGTVIARNLVLLECKNFNNRE
jgi:hypothetical protein